VNIPQIVTAAAATIRLVLTMAGTDNAKNTSPMMQDLKTDPEKAAQAEGDLGGETDRDPSELVPGDVAKVEDAGPPDGGTAAWLVVLGAWCCSFSSPGWINSTYFLPSQSLDIVGPGHLAAIWWTNSNAPPLGVGSFQQYYEIGPLKDYSSSTIAWIPSMQLFFLFALGPVAGVLFDKYGPRPLIIVGTLLHVFGLMMASLAKTYYQFILSQGVCSAIGVAFLYTPGKFHMFPPP
jgi:hypothetical protein